MFNTHGAGRDALTAQDQQQAASGPGLALPRGGGAIRGIGEKFAANPVTGTGSLNVPLYTSPGRSGFGPLLSLSYDSGAGNGPFGFGWHLSLPEITRKTDKGLPQYRDADESDVFILSGTEDLVPVLGETDGQWHPLPPFEPIVDGRVYTVQRFRPRLEGLFARIERWTEQETGDVHWRSLSRDNVTTLYGKTDESRIADPADATRVFSWLTCESYDDKGQAILYRYVKENAAGVDRAQAHEKNRTKDSRSANRYLKRIHYGNRTPHRPGEDLILRTDWLFEVVLDYGEHDPDTPKPQDAVPWLCRHDSFSSYRAGFEVRTYRLCRRVLMFHHFPDEAIGDDCLVRSTDLAYRNGRGTPEDATRGHPVFSCIESITQRGYTRRAGGYVTRAMPPLEFEYSEANIQDELHEVDEASLENVPYGLDGTQYQWVDLDGEGLPGLLTEQAAAWFYKRNLSPVALLRGADGRETVAARFAPVEVIAKQPSLAQGRTGQQQFLDLAGDGQTDLVQLGRPLSGYYERTPEAGWSTFVPFESTPVLDTSDPNLKFVDLTGDGHADLLVSEDEVFTWYPSLAEAGFGPPKRVRQALDEEQGPRLIFADETQSIYLADLSGDGLTDLARIRNGEVCYWPNLGYGRFGTKVTMDDAPWFDAPDLFDQKRIRLADIDGSGTTDILYLGRAGVHLYSNQSGNRWSEAHTLSPFPHIDSLSSVTAVDLLGNGTACLVWSSPLPGNGRQPMRYIDLMGGQKPHLLIQIVNNLGAETRIRYAPSTKFYLADKLAGTPWITRLPFPVHVVERVETYDHISRNRFVTRYAYHHGHFDGEEREFRGFGRVDTFDTQTLAALADPEAPLPEATNMEAASHVPPVCTKTWFHTGAFLDGHRISRQFEEEYYREGDADLSVTGLTDAQQATLLLEDTLLPDSVRLQDGTRVAWSLSGDEARQACRALKGADLRQEVYALDGTEAEDRPYSVSERNYTVEMFQPPGTGAEAKHAVFFTHPREQLDVHYERTLVDAGAGGPLRADPRVSHALTLATDAVGNVLRSVAIGYRRREGPGGLEPEQKQTHLTLTVNRFANRTGEEAWYRVGVPVETRTYEVVRPPEPTLAAGLVAPFRFEAIAQLTTGLFPLDRIEPPSANTWPYERWDWRHNPASASPDTRLRLIEHARTRYRRDNLTGFLPLGEIESLALAGESYTLALTPGLVAEVYGGRINDPMLETEGGYVHSEGDSDWWIPSGTVFYSVDRNDTPAQELAYARQHFFLPHRYRDPFGQTTTVRFDAYDLLMLETRDPLDNRVTAGERRPDGTIDPDKPGNDYRVLQPRQVMDPNRNRTAVAFDALGIVAGTAVMGKPEEHLGDTLEAFEADLSEAVLLGHLASPLADPYALLGRATIRLVYDLFAYRRTRDQPDPQPAVVYTLARETHDADLDPGQQTKIQHSVSYTDGFGREIQKKIQAEPGPLAAGGPGVSPRWVGSGWTIFNNKGKPVRRYEPFFTGTHRFEFDVRIGVSPILFYDPVERVVATLHPNHTWEKVVFDPWRQETWDVNDTVPVADPATDAHVGAFFGRLPDADYRPAWHALRTDPAHAATAGLVWPDPDLRKAEATAAEKAAAHAQTPSLAHADSLGRTFLTVAHNRFERDGAVVDEHYPTRVTLDIEGNRRAVVDARNRLVMRYDYDLLGHVIHQAGMEAGERWMLSDVAGQPIRAWDSRRFLRRMTYDELRRPTGLYVTENGAERLAERTVYGEGRGDAVNHRTRIFQVFDGAGVVTSVAYDFKGNQHEHRRDLLPDYTQAVNWLQNPVANDGRFTGHTTYDALNRPLTLTTPDGSVYRPAFNEANLLDRVDVNLRGAAAPTAFVTNIDYDAKGRRTRIAYGNGAQTTYEYDPLTFRLTHLKTTRPANPDATGSQVFRNATVVQDLHYTYDPAGNITRIRDGALKTIFHDQQQVEPVGAYTYDAIYRLIEAAGREHIGQTAHDVNPPNDRRRDYPFIGHRAHPNDLQALRTYTERYAYDAVGNFDVVRHIADGGRWTRRYEYDEDSLLEADTKSNRLTRTTVGNGLNFTETYRYTDEQGNDVHGCMTALNGLAMTWDFEDQLQQVDLGGGGTAYYAYDAGGQRVRKVIHRQNGARREERLYLGAYERYREYDGDGQTITLERETLHVTDDQQRIALVETRTAPAVEEPLVRYQFGNHLGSSSLELDDNGDLISYEEYYSYGTTSYQAMRSAAEVSLKRYRYTGKERDEETGLYYHGARYYAPWIGRWVSCDPPMAGIKDPHATSPGQSRYKEGLSLQSHEPLYEAFHLNPILYVDPDGRDPKDPPSEPPQREPGKGRFKHGQGEEQREGLERAQDYQKKNRPSLKENPKKRDPNANNEWEGESKRPKQRKIESGKKSADRDRKERDEKYKDKDSKQSTSGNQKTSGAPGGPYRQPGERPYSPDHPYFPEPQPRPKPSPVPPPTPPPPAPAPAPESTPKPDSEPGKPYFPEPTPRPAQPEPPHSEPGSAMPAWKKGLLVGAGITLITVGVIGTAVLAADDVTGVGVADDVLIPVTVGLVVVGAGMVKNPGGGS